MANEKVFNTRVLLKNDIEANWIKATGFTPKLGELIIYNAEIEGDTTQLPKDSDGQNLRNYYITYPRLKIGDNSNNVNDLPFIDKAIWDQFAQITMLVASDDDEGNVSLVSQAFSPASEGVY